MRLALLIVDGTGSAGSLVRQAGAQQADDLPILIIRRQVRVGHADDVILDRTTVGCRMEGIGKLRHADGQGIMRRGMGWLREDQRNDEA